MFFKSFKSSSGNKWFIFVVSLVFEVATLLIGLWFLIIPGIVSLNVQFELIVLSADAVSLSLSLLNSSIF